MPVVDHLKAAAERADRESSTLRTAMRGDGYNKLWLWFGLSRSAFLTLPRVLMHEMPDKWQADMARLLEEFDEAFPNTPAGATVVKPSRGKWPDWLLNYRRPQHEDIDTARPR